MAFQRFDGYFNLFLNLTIFFIVGFIVALILTYCIKQLFSSEIQLDFLFNFGTRVTVECSIILLYWQLTKIFANNLQLKPIDEAFNFPQNGMLLILCAFAALGSFYFVKGKLAILTNFGGIIRGTFWITLFMAVFRTIRIENLGPAILLGEIFYFGLSILLPLGILSMLSFLHEMLVKIARERDSEDAKGPDSITEKQRLEVERIDAEQRRLTKERKRIVKLLTDLKAKGQKCEKIHKVLVKKLLELKKKHSKNPDPKQLLRMRQTITEIDKVLAENQKLKQEFEQEQMNLERIDQQLKANSERLISLI